MKKLYFVLVNIVIALVASINCCAESDKIFRDDKQSNSLAKINSNLTFWFSDTGNNIKEWWNDETPEIMNWMSERGSEIPGWCEENGSVTWDWMKQTDGEAYEWGKQASLDLRDWSSKEGEKAKKWIIDNEPMLKKIAIEMGTEMLLGYLEENYPEEMAFVMPFIETPNGNILVDFLNAL